MIKLQLIFNLVVSINLIFIAYWQYLQGKFTKNHNEMAELTHKRLTKLEKKR